jgi:hypothetical protein
MHPPLYANPYYLHDSMQNLYLTEMEYEKDMDRMKELYPHSVRRIVEQVEEACDRMEYEGSLMFDEYPDRLMIEQLIDRICRDMRQQPDPNGSGEPGESKLDRDTMWELVGVILNNEMYRRRCRHRRYRRWW